MKINEKEYKINKNPNLGTLEKMDKLNKEGTNNLDDIFDIIQNLLIPKISLKDIKDNMGFDELYEILEEFQKIQKEKAIEIKKKLSQ